MIRRVLVLASCIVIVVSAACSSDDEGDGESSNESGGSTESTEPRPDGPAAELEKMSGGDGIFLTSILQQEFDGGGDDEGYTIEEYLATGTATAYQTEGELTADGRWTFEPSSEADYATRIVVRRPESASDSSGTVVVEWLNVSGGVDADPEYTSLREELVRQGHTWVGVSAQKIGVEGGETAVEVNISAAAEFQGEGLKTIDPDRYGELVHPGDGYSYDIYTQVTRAIREGGPVLGEAPSTVIAAGESQSAAALVTYINGVQPLTEAFDGFYVHSRGGASLPLGEAGGSSDMAAAISGGSTIIRTDLDVPVMDVQTENDITSILGSIEARQDDSDVFRLWEVAGTAHADAHLVGPTVEEELDCGVAINDGPMHVVAKAALRALVTWVTDGEAPPEAPRIEVTEGDAPAIRRDADGLALGGIRTPPLDVPAEILSGESGPSTAIICLLLGSTKPMPVPRLTALYESPDAYHDKYEAAIDAAIEAGFVLEDDRAAIEAYARPDVIPG